MPTTANINGPTRYMRDPQYQADCKFALEASFESLMKHAVAAGWEPRQVAYSLMILAAEKVQEFSGPTGASEPV